MFGGDTTKVNQDLWSQFMSFQGPAMQSLVSAYMDQSKQMYEQMQSQLQNQTKSMFAGFQFPGFPPATGSPPGDKSGNK